MIVSSIENNILVALDFNNEKDALNLAERLDPTLCRLKIGKQLFTYCGPALVEKLANKGFDIFLDLKFHDIPSTVANACVAAADIGAWMMNVHAQGGIKMMAAARNALDKRGDAPLLIAVTMLTSMDKNDLQSLSDLRSPTDVATQLASLAHYTKMDGIVCSAQEAMKMKVNFGKKFTLVTPGIRPKGTEKGDQKRIMTPEMAVRAGSDYLVIGRPITESPDPIQTLLRIKSEISSI